MKARQKAPRFPEELLHLEATPRLELGMRVLQTRALPLGYVALCNLAERVGFEPTWAVRPERFSRPPRYDHFDTPPSFGSKNNPLAILIKLVPRAGIEPATRGFSVHCSTD